MRDVPRSEYHRATLADHLVVPDEETVRAVENHERLVLSAVGVKARTRAHIHEARLDDRPHESGGVHLDQALRSTRWREGFPCQANPCTAPL